jgi:uncharacterized protein YkwD
MKVRFVGLWFLISAFVVSLGLTSPQVTQSQTPKSLASSGLSEAERDLLSEINQLRANPQAYAGYLEKMRPLFSGKQYKAAGREELMTQEGWTAVDEAIKFLRTTKPIGPLGASRGLSLAALAHCKDQGTSGGTGHRGAEGTFIEQRVKPFGNWQGGIGENITYGNDSARERLLTWLIDDGFPSRGHRRRLLSTEYNVAGISCGPHPEFGAMCVLTLAGGFTELQTAATTDKPTRATTTKTPSAAAKTKNTNMSGKIKKM